jgi:hypothetical protein
MKFNWQRYIELNPDLIEAGIDNECSAIRHYLNHGIDENRRYGSVFLSNKIKSSTNSAYMILIKAIDQIANKADDQDIRDCIISTLKLSKNIKEPFVAADNTQRNTILSMVSKLTDHKIFSSVMHNTDLYTKDTYND